MLMWFLIGMSFLLLVAGDAATKTSNIHFSASIALMMMVVAVLLILSGIGLYKRKKRDDQGESSKGKKKKKIEPYTGHLNQIVEMSKTPAGRKYKTVIHRFDVLAGTSWQWLANLISQQYLLNNPNVSRPTGQPTPTSCWPGRRVVYLTQRGAEIDSSVISWEFAQLELHEVQLRPRNWVE